ncbi:uncharacterized protein LOC129948775 [Eupeodes corollae]|uniref:uncharacterized protein LOC129948775 n=1 Tax=Eupeodes corollae TaxID=290404 RepID=UPI0024931594|nr:uncharacterized protein LOC129948775 [Eupeodes corollae]
MNICRRVLIFIAILGLFFYVKATINVKIFKNNCIVHDPKTIQNISCSVKPLNRTTTAVNISGYIIRNVSNLLINAQLFKKSEINYRPFLVNVTENYCDYFSKNKGGAYMRLVAPIYMPYTNMNHTCPFYGYGFLKDLPISRDKLPKFWPPGSYRLDLLAYEKNYGKLLTIQLYFDIKEIRQQ